MNQDLFYNRYDIDDMNIFFITPTQRENQEYLENNPRVMNDDAAVVVTLTDVRASPFHFFTLKNFKIFFNFKKNFMCNFLFFLRVSPVCTPVLDPFLGGDGDCQDSKKSHEGDGGQQGSKYCECGGGDSGGDGDWQGSKKFDEWDGDQQGSKYCECWGGDSGGGGSQDSKRFLEWDSGGGGGGGGGDDG